MQVQPLRCSLDIDLIMSTCMYFIKVYINPIGWSLFKTNLDMWDTRTEVYWDCPLRLPLQNSFGHVWGIEQGLYWVDFVPLQNLFGHVFEIGQGFIELILFLRDRTGVHWVDISSKSRFYSFCGKNYWHTNQPHLHLL